MSLAATALLRAPAAALALTAALASPAAADLGLTGTWARGDGGAVVRITRCGAAWCAENTWVAPERRGRESIGDVLEMRVEPQGPRRLAGTAFDRRRDASYRMTIDVAADRLKARGCVLLGLLCIDMTFNRVADAAATR
jgi:uncharacterized protein (DUF2147 family)